jgi:hypothetical protein
MIPHYTERLAALLAASLAAGALAAPAVAVPGFEPRTTAEPEPTPTQAPVVRIIDDGFDWGSAAIGAGGAGAVIVLVTLGGVAYVSRDRMRAAR